MHHKQSELLLFFNKNDNHMRIIDAELNSVDHFSF